MTTSRHQVSLGDAPPFIEAGPHACGATHRGGRPANEDAILVTKLEGAILLAVADGLGGHADGEVASRIAIDTLREVLEKEYCSGAQDEMVETLLRQAHLLVHTRIRRETASGRAGMGTTLVSAIVRDGTAVIANTGDSRATIVGRDVQAVTKDHSLVQGLVDQGEITPGAARAHPLRHIVTKALGLEYGVDWYRTMLHQGDMLVLSSDGFHDFVTDADLVEAKARRRCSEVVQALLTRALATSQDNVSLVVCRRPPGSAPRE
ncbi:MAG: serine/threonine-protein phosphatase [Methanobacteriota archaeon]|nr:MAG: serine/threonine-protein phosphatase [Euryarchaeota archaeon]